jgi:hypothetical protein
MLNTVDASVGAVITENQVKQLPLEARDVAALYSIQPGVVYLGNRPDMNVNNDTRSGAVNGARSDQSNILLDGVDVNDQTRGYAFTSVLRMTPDAMQEFRVESRSSPRVEAIVFTVRCTSSPATRRQARMTISSRFRSCRTGSRISHPS